jgi:hypothetical protein
MIKRWCMAICVCCLLFMTGCGGPRIGVYTIRLQEVETNPVAPIRDMMFSTAGQPDGTTQYIYEDPSVRITWKLTNTRFGFLLDNLTADTLTVDWEHASYINQNQDTLRVIHDEIDFSMKDTVQQVTAVPPFGSLEDFLLPAFNIYYDPDNFTLWRINYLFYHRKGNIGQNVSVELPMTIEGTSYRYRFRFTIEDWKDITF